MKKYLLLLSAILFLGPPAFSQDELRIHHINIEDGDATMIGIYNTVSRQYESMILIDGGESNPNALLLPYLRNVTNSANPHFKYVALTHYHKDHYNGLSALRDGRISADSVLDPAGYNFQQIFPRQISLRASEPNPASLTIAQEWLTTLARAAALGFVKGHATGFISYGATRSSSLGHKILLGTANGLPVILECVAGWGNSLNGNGITPDPAPTKNNANNFTLSFILTCGEFRYFIGGDLGGVTHGDYIDQETSLTSEFAKEFPETFSYNHNARAVGHICGFKANHHGSDYSSSAGFITAMTPAIVVTSAGKQPTWHLPSPAFLERLNQIKPLSNWTSSTQAIASNGFYFTNLYDFTNFPSRTKAGQLFNSRTMTSFNYGNVNANEKSSFLITMDASVLNNKSAFSVFKMANAGTIATRLANFACHSR